MPRVRITKIHKKGLAGIETYWRDLSQQPLPDSLDTVLATAGLLSLTEEFEDYRMTYEKPEYECYWCGRYGHADDDCPEPHEE